MTLEEQNRLAQTTDALEFALEPWSGSAKINGIKLIKANREILKGLTFIEKRNQM